MKNRIRTTGVTLCPPIIDDGKQIRWISPDIFVEILQEICPGFAFRPTDVDDLYWKLLRASGEHFDEKSRPAARQIAGRLRSLIPDLQTASEILSAHDTGIRTESDLNCARFVFETLLGHPGVEAAVNRQLTRPELGKRCSVRQNRQLALAGEANKMMSSWGEICKEVAHTFEVAAAALATDDGNPPGRARLTWYAAFVRMLIEIGQISGFANDRAVKRRKKGEPRWLLRAAEEFEKHFPADMRSVSSAARNRRVRESEKSITRRSK